MGFDISSVTASTSSAVAGLGAAASLSSLAVALVQPKKEGIQPQTANGVSFPVFMFDYEGEQTIALDSDITDHYVEDNTAIQDNIALKPEVITTSGFIGELTDIVPFGLNGITKTAQKSLGIIAPYAPALSTTATQVLNNAQLAVNVASTVAGTVTDAWATLGLSVGGKGIQTKQQQAFNKFYSYWQKRLLFTIITPWGSFSDMAIQSLRSAQDADTNSITNFEVTFKKIRFAKTITKSPTTTKAGRASAQSALPVNLGASPTAASVAMNAAAPLAAPAAALGAIG
jgi:hypothetical protein